MISLKLFKPITSFFPLGQEMITIEEKPIFASITEAT